jgi:hypothetical protein
MDAPYRKTYSISEQLYLGISKLPVEIENNKTQHKYQKFVFKYSNPMQSLIEFLLILKNGQTQNV